MSKHRLLSFQVPLPFLQTLHEVTKPRLSKSHVWLTQHDYGGCCFPKCGSHLSKDKNMRWNQIHRVSGKFVAGYTMENDDGCPWLSRKGRNLAKLLPFYSLPPATNFLQKLPKARLSNIPGELVFWVQAECTTSSIRYMKKNPKQTKISAKFSSLGNWSSKDSRIWM